MNIVLYVVESSYLLAAVSFLAIGALSRNPGSLIAAPLFVLSATLSFCLLAGAFVTGTLFFYGTGRRA